MTVELNISGYVLVCNFLLAYLFLIAHKTCTTTDVFGPFLLPIPDGREAT